MSIVPNKPPRISPSSAGWAVDNNILTDTKVGCLRFLLLKYYLPVDDPVPAHLIEMGAWGEDRYEEYLKNDQEHAYHKEFEMESSIDDVLVRGRIDFITHHKTFRVIHEVKTSQSKNLLYKNLRKGDPKVNHLGQLVFYLIHLNETRGKLIYRYAPTNELRIMKVEIGDSGEIYVDGKEHHLRVENQIRHQLLSAQVIKEKIMWQRPAGSACKWCVYNSMCDRYDVCGKSFENFITEEKKNV